MKNITKLLALMLSLLAITCFSIACAPSTPDNGGEGQTPPQHTHEYSTIKFDETNYWKECSCGEKAEVTAHSLTDEKCSCGYEKEEEEQTPIIPDTPTHTHEYKTVTFDDANHWKECSCGEKAEVTAHSLTDGKCACGYEQAPSVPDAPTHTHEYKTVKYDDNNHWKECSCGEKTEVTAHCFTDYKDNGDNTKTAECDNGCGKTNTIEKEHEHNYASVIIPPTCEDKGYTTYTCGCGDTYRADEVKALGHNYGDFVSDGDGIHHTKTCTNDSDHKITESCGGGEANCTKKANCSVCGVEYGDILGHNYIDNIRCNCGKYEPSYYTKGLVFELIDEVYSVIDYTGNSGTVVIPSVYNQKPVTSIGVSAFSPYSSFQSVVIPDSVTSIGNAAFKSCHSLLSVVIPDSVTSIGYMAFSDCHNLQFNEYGGCKYLGSSDNDYFALIEAVNKFSSYDIHKSTKIIADYAFFGLEMLSTIEIPDSVTSIGDFAFFSCTSLTSVVIGTGVISIGDYAFNGCSKLKSVVYKGSIDGWVEIEFGDSYSNPLYYTKKLIINGQEVTEVKLTTATKINDFAFRNCNTITSVVIGDSVKSIGNSAFSCCSSLTSVIIGDRVKSIGMEAFYDCDSLKSVVIEDSVTSIGSFAFEECGSLTSIVIPNSVIGSYAFWYCGDLTIYCVVESKPDGWNSLWKPSRYSVVWGYKG